MILLGHVLSLRMAANERSHEHSLSRNQLVKLVAFQQFLLVSEVVNAMLFNFRLWKWTCHKGISLNF